MNAHANVAAINRPRLRADDVFFPAMALVILAIVVYGFSQSFFLAGTVFAKLPNNLVRVHGTLFVFWIFLLVAQTLAIPAGRRKWHVRIGILGAIVPPLLFVFGILTLVDSIRRTGTPVPPELLLVADFEELALFVGLTIWGIVARRHAPTHKRLMILGTMAMIGPAIDRFGMGSVLATFAVYLTLPLCVVAYDLITTRKLFRATALGSAAIAIATLTALPVAQWPIWERCVSWIVHAH